MIDIDLVCRELNDKGYWCKVRNGNQLVLYALTSEEEVSIDGDNVSFIFHNKDPWKTSYITQEAIHNIEDVVSSIIKFINEADRFSIYFDPYNYIRRLIGDINVYLEVVPGITNLKVRIIKDGLTLSENCYRYPTIDTLNQIAKNILLISLGYSSKIEIIDHSRTFMIRYNFSATEQLSFYGLNEEKDKILKRVRSENNVLLLYDTLKEIGYEVTVNKKGLFHIGGVNIIICIYDFGTKMRIIGSSVKNITRKNIEELIENYLI